MFTAAELRDLVGAQPADDLLLDHLQDGALAFIAGETGRYFGAPEEVTETPSGGGGRFLWLKEAPVEDATMPVTVVESGTTLTEGTDYEREGRMLIRTGRPWDTGFRTIEVTYHRGYPAGDEPGDIRNAVIEMVGFAFQTHGKEAFQSESIGGYSYVRPTTTTLGKNGVPLRAWRTIQRYRRVRV